MTKEYNEDVDTSEEPTTDEALSKEVEELKKENEDLKEQRRGLSKKVKAVKKAKPQSNSDERLDRLELRQIDSDLSSEQISDILLIKNTKGLENVNDAYKEPMVQAFLDAERAKNDKKQKIDKAIPSSQNQNAGSVKSSRRVSNNNKDWVKKMPSDNTQDVADELTKRFFD